jgi:Tol biopolymer transport system component
MSGFQKSHLIRLFVLGLLLSGCGQVSSLNAGQSEPNFVSSRTTQGFTPLPEPSKSILLSTATISPTLASKSCKKIAFVMSGQRNPDIYTVCPDGSNLRGLTTYPPSSSGSNVSPAWSPDGSRIAFSSTRTDSSQIYIMGKDGSNPTEITFDYSNDLPIWLPNGQQIAFRTTDGKGLWWWRILNLATNQITPFTRPSYDFFFQTPAWSPDGKQIATMSLLEQKLRNDGSSQIHVENVDGSNERGLTSDIWENVNPVWSPDGTKIGFISERGGTYNVFALYVMANDGTNIQKLFGPILSDRVKLTWAPDGQHVAVSDEVKIFVIDINTRVSRELLQLPAGESASEPSWQP